MRKVKKLIQLRITRPRKPRIDAPGALQHVILQGINRQAILSDEAGLH